MFTPPEVNIMREEDTITYIKVEPLESGFGTTLGNSLRRMLLSSISGSAITDVAIDGVEHEYSTIEGVREDVVNILLNLRKVAVGIADEYEAHITLKANKKGRITASDFNLPEGVSIANPNQHIATLVSDKSSLQIDAHVQKGHGYRTADEVDRSQLPVNRLLLDAVFNPVKRVAYRVESMRQGERTNLDSLVLELETDGSVDSKEVLGRAAALLTNQLNPFLKFGGAIDQDTQMRFKKYPEVYDLKVDDASFGLILRTQNNLLKEGINYVGQLIQLAETELMKTPNLGKKSIQEIKEKLAEKGLTLGMSIDTWKVPLQKD